MDRNLKNMVVYLQRGKYLCWAANIQTLFNYLFSLHLTQCDILRYAFNEICCNEEGIFLDFDQPFNLDNALTAINNVTGRRLHWEFANGHLNVEEIKTQFGSQLPVILSMRTSDAEFGHYIILLGFDENNQFIVGDPYQSETASYFHCTPADLSNNYRGLQWAGTYMFSI